MKVWGVTGWKNSGKTTMVAALVRAFSARGLVVSTLKHAHRGFDLDQPGTDSSTHREAGAREVLVASGTRWALMHEAVEDAAPSPDRLLSRMGPADLVLIEGFKQAPHPKIETLAPGFQGKTVAAGVPGVRAFAGVPPPGAPRLPAFARDDIDAIADFIAAELAL